MIMLKKNETDNVILLIISNVIMPRCLSSQSLCITERSNMAKYEIMKLRSKQL